jgi:hypothetical protein
MDGTGRAECTLNQPQSDQSSRLIPVAVEPAAVKQSEAAAVPSDAGAAVGEATLERGAKELEQRV